MRHALTTVLRWLFEALVRLYYPSRTVEGGEQVPPPGQPVIFVLNHPNGLLDPLLLRVALGRPARFLGKSTLFANPLGRLAMDAFGTIPVYRAREAGAAAGDASRNDETFARCRQALAAMSSATLPARSGLSLVRTWKVMPTSGTSDQGKPKKKFTNRSGSRASHVRACCTRFIHGEAPVHWKTVGEMIGTFRVTWVGT